MIFPNLYNIESDEARQVLESEFRQFFEAGGIITASDWGRMAPLEKAAAVMVRRDLDRVVVEDGTADDAVAEAAIGALG